MSIKLVALFFFLALAFSCRTSREPQTQTKGDERKQQQEHKGLVTDLKFNPSTHMLSLSAIYIGGCDRPEFEILMDQDCQETSPAQCSAKIWQTGGIADKCSFVMNDTVTKDLRCFPYEHFLLTIADRSIEIKHTPEPPNSPNCKDGEPIKPVEPPRDPLGECDGDFSLINMEVEGYTSDDILMACKVKETYFQKLTNNGANMTEKHNSNNLGVLCFYTVEMGDDVNSIRYRFEPSIPMGDSDFFDVYVPNIPQGKREFVSGGETAQYSASKFMDSEYIHKFTKLDFSSDDKSIDPSLQGDPNRKTSMKVVFDQKSSTGQFTISETSISSGVGFSAKLDLFDCNQTSYKGFK